MEFYDGSMKIGEDAIAPYALSLTNVAVGDHWLAGEPVSAGITISKPSRSPFMHPQSRPNSSWGCGSRSRRNLAIDGSHRGFETAVGFVFECVIDGWGLLNEFAFTLLGLGRARTSADIGEFR